MLLKLMPFDNIRNNVLKVKESIQCQYLRNEIDPKPTLKAKYQRTMTEQKRMWRV